MINTIWFFLIAIGIIFSITTNNINNINTSILSSGNKTIDIMLFIIPNIILWNGIMTIAFKSGLLSKVSNLMKPLLNKLFPTIPKNHPSLDFISSNIIINMVGLSSAATPIGLKAMEQLQKLNTSKTTASKDMITFIVLNTTGLTIIPTTIIALRTSYNSADASSIIIPSILATISCTIFGITLDRWHRKRYDKHK